VGYAPSALTHLTGCNALAQSSESKSATAEFEEIMNAFPAPRIEFIRYDDRAHDHVSLCDHFFFAARGFPFQSSNVRGRRLIPLTQVRLYVVGVARRFGPRFFEDCLV
jgi:hypothetical protein